MNDWELKKAYMFQSFHYNIEGLKKYQSYIYDFPKCCNVWHTVKLFKKDENQVGRILPTKICDMTPT